MGNEGAQVAVSLVAECQAPTSVGHGRGGRRSPPPEPLTSLQDLRVFTAALDVLKTGYSSAACVALSLVVLLGGRLPAKQRGPVVGVTGDIDLRGRVLGVGGIREKLQVMQRTKLFNSLLVLPESTYNKLELSGEMEQEWPPDVRDYAGRVMRAASNLPELMAVIMPGLSERGVTATLGGELDGPQVGVGVRTGLVDDMVGRFEFQACSVSPGSQAVILTGHLSPVTKESVALISDSTGPRSPSAMPGARGATQAPPAAPSP